MSKARVAGIRARLQSWPPARDPDPVQRIRNLLSAAADFDVLEDPDEGAVAYVILDFAQRQYPPADLERILTYIIHNPDTGAVLTQVPDLGTHGQITESDSRERSALYAEKLLKRLLGK